MNDDLNPTPAGHSRAYRWLAESFEDRTIAEMSICFCITATASFIALALLLGAALGVGREEQRYSESQTQMAMLAGLGLWLGLLIWLAASFVRIARGWPSQRLGTRTFKRMQRVFLVMAALTMLGQGVIVTQLSILLLALLVFDVAILEMVVVFLLLAWLARCKVPRRTYWDIAVIALVFVLQVILFR